MMASVNAMVAILAVLVVSCSLRVLASDPSPLQDFCVADKLTPVFVNGFVCKNPRLVIADDFLFRGLVAGNMMTGLGAAVSAVTVNELPGLNTLGISLARIDFSPNGLNPPHTHPRATEVLTVLQGTLLVGFVTSNQLNNQLFTKQLVQGDVFVFPQGLIHFQFNNGMVPAVAFAGLSSQNPGVITIADAVFGSKPLILDVVLAKAFRIDKAEVDWIQAQFAVPGGIP